MAIAGLIYLVSPGVTAPDPLGVFLMATSGAAWGVYTLLGRRVYDPLAASAMNFIYLVPLAILLSPLFYRNFSATAEGLALAAASGGLASGIGYVVWYNALRGLTAGRATTVQLSVPALAAIGGAVILSEPLTIRLIVASAITLGGVALVLTQRTVKPPPLH